MLRHLAREGLDAVVFDDVLSYLDQAAQKAVLGLIRERTRSEGWGSLYVTTEISHLTQVADEFYFFDNGAPVALGPDLSRVAYPPAARYCRDYAELVAEARARAQARAAQ